MNYRKISASNITYNTTTSSMWPTAIGSTSIGYITNPRIELSPNETITVTGNLSINNYDEIKILDIDVVVPEKVMIVKLSHYGLKKDIKLVTHEDDTFDLKRGVYLAISKELYGKDYTLEGVEHKATELQYKKGFNNMVEKAVKTYYKKIKEENEKLEKEEAEKKRIEQKKQKEKQRRLRRKEKREALKRSKNRDDMRDAIISAMKYMKNDDV